MTTVEPLEVKVIYSASRRGPRPTKRVGPRSSTNTSLLVTVGVLSLAVAGALYYATWLRADPKLRVRLFMRTPLPGVNLDDVAQALVPPDAKDAAISPRPASGPRAVTASEGVRLSSAEVQAQLTEAKLRVAIVVGWVALVTVAIAVLAVCGGALTGRGLDGSRRALLCIVGVIALAGLGWSAYSRLGPEWRFVPQHLRLGVGAGLIVLAMAGTLVARGGRGLAYVAAVLLILSAAGTVAALQLTVQHEVVKLDELPMQLLPLSICVFVAQSLWGWILLPLAPRLRSGR
ncbi:MAG: hypothetical protein PVI86_08895 [Phycisphaerae bacterium]|jgi:hypothetical protein